MSEWFTSTIADTGRLPLFCMMIAFGLAFVFIRTSTRLIRAEVPWWPGNVTPGGIHIHHVVFGLVLMLASGFGFVGIASYHTPVANCVFASLFGIGSALVLDEFALVLHLRDVYWSEEGRASVDAVFVAFAITVLFALGIHPIGMDGEAIDRDSRAMEVVSVIILVLQYALAIVTLAKGKIWTGLIGLFFPLLIVVGAVRIARPRSPWARWRYAQQPTKLRVALGRERRYRAPVSRSKIRLQEAIAGRHDLTL
ncbi:hypothetical protein [Rhodococcus sp. O3]|uniref:hypothetical protein n=1 Tax=Rhodococcus sp. O3 TaxID=3404919 RepID=UPI003B671D96